MINPIDVISKFVGDDEAKAGEKSAEKKGEPGFLDKFKIAYERASKAKDKGMFERVKIFATTLVMEFLGLDEEQKAVTKKTETEVKSAVDDAMKGAKDKANLSGATPEDSAAYDEVLAIGVASKASLDAEHTALADSAMGKVQERVAGKNSDMCTFDETTTMAGMALMTLAQLRDKYPDKFTFIKALQKFSEVSEKSKFPISKLFADNVLALFRIDLDDNQLNAASLLGKFGMGALGIGVLGKFGKEDAIAAFNSLKSSPMTDEEKTVDFFKDHIFVNTEKDNVKDALHTINSMLLAGDKKLDPLALTDLIFKIDRRDYNTLVTALVGPENYLARKAAVS